MEREINWTLLIAFVLSILIHLSVLNLVTDLVFSKEAIKQDKNSHYQISYLASSGTVEESKATKSPPSKKRKEETKHQETKKKSETPKEKEAQKDLKLDKEQMKKDDKSNKRKELLEQVESNFDLKEVDLPKEQGEKLTEDKEKKEARNELKEEEKVKRAEKTREQTNKKEKKEVNTSDASTDSRKDELKQEAKKDLNKESEVVDLTAGAKDDISYPSLTNNQSPQYPEKMRRRGIEGQVKLKVLITKEGRVKEIEIASSSGYQSLDGAAKKAVMDWQFKPAQRENYRVHSWVLIPISFKLHR